MRSKEDIEKELSNVIKDIENDLGEDYGLVKHLNATREALYWVLGETNE